MVILEKWIPKNQFQPFIMMAKRAVLYQTFFGETENKEESFITEHPNSQLEIVSTDYRPVAELIFPKIKEFKRDHDGRYRIVYCGKGFKAMGNQLTTDKLKQVNLLEPLPYDIPVEVIPEDLEVRGETNADDSLIQLDDDGQITLTLE
jgi:topoisomerase-4 subunit A